ncbi:hypothetical protein BJ165DRAFT_999867 [Panaeolus papilionaceus]|nr:hypothetical protein BJ165DRAFT_999867 [Panaeolus papilionaceus]
MLDGGIDTDTALLLTSLSNRWMRGMLWGDQGSESSNVFPRRWSARKIVEDHFASLDPRPMTQDDKDLDTCWIQDEAKWLEDEVRRIKEAEKDEVAVGGNEEIGETGDRPGECVQPGEELVDEKGSGASTTDEDVPDDIGAQNKKLILLHHNKHAVAELIEELKEKGVNEADSEMQSLKSVSEEKDRKLREYWEKVTGLPTPQTQNDTVGVHAIKQVVDLGGYDAQASRQKVEQTIQYQLHSGAKSLAFFIRLGRGSINSRIRYSVIKDILDRCALPFSLNHYDNGIEVYGIERTERDFGSWLERFRTENNF